MNVYCVVDLIFLYKASKHTKIERTKENELIETSAPTKEGKKGSFIYMEIEQSKENRSTSTPRKGQLHLRHFCADRRAN